MSLTLPFLAGLLLKMYEKQSWTAEEMETVRFAIAESAAMTQSMTDPPALTESTEHATEPAIEPPKHEAPKKVKKVKKVEAEASVPPVETAETAPETNVETTTETVPEILVISAKHCLARMVQKNKVIPGTEDNKVYETKQCIRLRAKGQLLCPKCEEYYTAYKEKSKGKANWEGFINEKPLDNLHIVGSKWFEENYPAGLKTTVIPVPVPSDPAKETLLAENEPVIEVKWAKVKISGIQYIYNALDRRTYRADISKEGEDQIMWESYSGKYIHGELDPYAPEDETVPT